MVRTIVYSFVAIVVPGTNAAPGLGAFALVAAPLLDARPHEVGAPHVDLGSIEATEDAGGRVIPPLGADEVVGRRGGGNAGEDEDERDQRQRRARRGANGGRLRYGRCDRSGSGFAGCRYVLSPFSLLPRRPPSPRGPRQYSRGEREPRRFEVPSALRFRLVLSVPAPDPPRRSPETPHAIASLASHTALRCQRLPCAATATSI